MDVLTWVVWGLGGVVYAAILLLTSRAERRFMDDPNRWASDGRVIIVPLAERVPRTIPVPRPVSVGLQAPGFVREVA